MANLLENVSLLNANEGDSEDSSDESDDELVVVREEAEQITLDDALLLVPQLEAQQKDSATEPEVQESATQEVDKEAKINAIISRAVDSLLKQRETGRVQLSLLDKLAIVKLTQPSLTQWFKKPKDC